MGNKHSKKGNYNSQKTANAINNTNKESMNKEKETKREPTTESKT